MAQTLKYFVCVFYMSSAVLSQKDTWYPRPSLGRTSELDIVQNANQSEATQLINETENSQRHSIRDNVIRHLSKRETSTSFPIIPENCKKQGYCTDMDYYPFEAVNTLLSKLNEEDYNRFQVDTLDQVSETDKNNATDVSTVHLCPSKIEILNITAAQDVNQKWHTVVNKKENPLQSFRSMICSKNPCDCSKYVKIEKGYSATCEQKFTYRLMVAITGDNELLTLPLSIPSCCACVVKMNLR